MSHLALKLKNNAFMFDFLQKNDTWKEIGPLQKLMKNR